MILACPACDQPSWFEAAVKAQRTTQHGVGKAEHRAGYVFMLALAADIIALYMVQCCQQLRTPLQKNCPDETINKKGSTN
jgi:hypothetical protein